MPVWRASWPLCDVVFLNNHIYKRNYWKCFGGNHMVVKRVWSFQTIVRQKVKMLWEVKFHYPSSNNYIQSLCEHHPSKSFPFTKVVNSGPEVPMMERMVNGG